MTENMPVQDVDAEQAVLGVVLLGGDKFDALVEVLCDADFYRDDHRYIWQAAESLFDDGQPIDLVSVASKLKDRDRLDAIGGYEHLYELMKRVPYAENGVRYATIVRDCALRRRVQAAGQRIAALGTSTDTPIDELSEQAEGLLLEATAERRESAPVLSGSELLMAWADCGGVRKNPISTGLPSLDEALLGGWQRHQVHVLTARTGKGKSNLVLRFARAAMEVGCRVGLISLEMDAHELVAKLMATHSGLPYGMYWRMVDPHLDECLAGGVPVRDVYDDAQDWLRQQPLKLWHKSGATISEVRRIARRMVQSLGCELVFVDLINRIRVPGATSIYERMAVANAELQALPDELHCPFVVVAQQNRETKGARASEGTIKGCGDIEEDSPVVLGLTYEDLDGRPTAKLEVLKSRDGCLRIGQKAIVLVGNSLTFDWTEAGYEEQRGYALQALQADDRDPWEVEDE